MENLSLLNIGIIIPCYNEENQIGILLEHIFKEVDIPHENILVVNDGSTDSTKSIVEKYDINVINHSTNIGKGKSILSGINFYKIRDDIKGVVVLDGDNQHNPKFIKDFIEKYNKTGANLIIGARDFSSSSMPFMRKLSNTITSFLVSKAIGVKIRDSQSGYRFLDRKAFELFNPQEYGFQAESEMLTIATANKLKIDHIDIDTIYHSNSNSKISPLFDTFKFIKWYLKLILKK